MDRRNFIYRGTGLIAGGFLVNAVPLKLFASSEHPDLCKIKSKDYYSATLKAVHELGGIRRFVPEGASVGFLINSAFEEPGTYPHPDIGLAILFLCWEAGAGEMVMLQPVAEEYWRRSDNFARHRFIIDELTQVESNVFPATFNDNDFELRNTIEGTAILKDIEIIKKISEVDVLINVRQPDLVVADAIEFITGNGPSGPGPLKRLDLVIAGTDPVAIDAFGSTCLDMDPSEILIVAKAYESGLGEMNLEKLSIVEYEV
jgi:uncharacterized protein (DUF362 family)